MNYINDVEGPESCNTYNMLKLTEDLFRVNPLSKYSDFYERALLNHILSTQHPEHGGYVYFTPARPRHYRVYSAPGQAMWCCVGSGMENHGKYSQFIYTHQNDSLFLNLFIPSDLNWREKGIKISQQTDFPFKEKTKLIIREAKSGFTLMLRYPSWVKAGALRIKVNGKEQPISGEPSSYISIKREWAKGDEIEILLPMQNKMEKMPNVPEYIAFMHGPVLLGAKTGKENLSGLIADDGRWSHMAHGEKLAVNKAPILIEDNISGIANRLKPVKDKPLTFTFSDVKMINPMQVILEPFFSIHDSRYSIYWMTLTNAQYRSYLDSLAESEEKKLDLQKRTVDFVAPGEQQPEADHAIQKENSNTGNFHNQFWRDASKGGFFSYNMATNSETGLRLIIRYWGAEWGNRKFDIYIDDEKLLTEDNTGRWNQSKFQDIEYTIPDHMLAGKDRIRVKFQAAEGNTAGAIYYIRLVRAK